MRRTTFNAGSGQYVILEPQSGRSVKISSTRIKPIVKSHEDRFGTKTITEIKYANAPLFKVNQQITLGKEPFKINHIKEHGSAFMLHASKLTKSSYFLLPFLGETRDYFLWNSQFVNVFMDFENPDIGSENTINVLYRFSKHLKYTEFEKKVQQHELFIKMIDVDKFHTVYSFNVPTGYEIEYEFFRQGAYSKFHEKYKEQILAFHGANKTSKLHRILNRAESLRVEMQTDLAAPVRKGVELHDPPVIEEETYLNKYMIKNILQPNGEFA